MDDENLIPPTLIYGSDKPDIRLRSRGGVHQYFCRNNRNLHVTKADLDWNGTYPAGALLEQMCRDHCLPVRADELQPCPAFVSNHRIGTENKGLATVVPRPSIRWKKCLGVQKLLDMAETPEERFFFGSYLDSKSGDDAPWRQQIVEVWNDQWSHVENGWGPTSRRAKFDHMMWSTLRYPALIPQVWLNWLHAASDEDLKILDEYPSRVDFVAFWHGERHLIEIDGPSHYATFDETNRTYSVDERSYARNLKIARSLERDGWSLTRIARIEIKDVIDGGWPEFEAFKFLEPLPFYPEEREIARGFSDLGVRELEPEQIPF